MGLEIENLGLALFFRTGRISWFVPGILWVKFFDNFKF